MKSALIKALRGGREGKREFPTISLDEYANFFTFNGLQYPFMPGTTLQQDKETPPSDFGGYVQQLYKANGIVFACMAARQRVFSQARFQFQRMTGGTPGELFGSPLLAPLEHPWGPSSTTSDLLGRMVQDADLAGNGYIGRLPGGRLTHMRPDWVIIVAGSKRSGDRNPNWQLDAEVIGYIYMPGGPNSGEDPELLQPEDVAHFAPHPDPTARFRGMSWLTPVIREIMGDSATTLHKLMFFENGATPNVTVSLDKDITPENFQKFVELFEDQNAGVINAYKTLFFGGGANIQVVGSNLQQLDFKVTQGAGETRIAAAAGLPAIIPGFSEGLQYATYSNYGQARRAFADGTLTHLWENAAGSLETLIDIKSLPGRGSNARLWYDDKHIKFLKADVKEDADVNQVKATTINTLITAGYEPEWAVKAVQAGDMSLLIGHHTGLVSVQLMKPGEKEIPSVPLPGVPLPGAAADHPPGGSNGNGSAPKPKPKPRELTTGGRAPGAGGEHEEEDEDRGHYTESLHPRKPDGKWGQGMEVPVQRKPFGDVHVTSSESPDVQQHQGDLDLLPAHAASLLKDKETQFYLGNQAVPDLDDMGHLQNVMPRGWPQGSGWKDVGAAFMPNTNTIVVGDVRKTSSISPALHETGHALDSALGGASKKKAMRKHHQRLFEQLSSYLQQDVPGSNAGRSEMFAEGVADVLSNPSYARVQYDDEFVDWMLDVLNGKRNP